jgi:hypothetical protein
MRRQVERELAVMLEVFEQRCVDQRVIAERYFGGHASTTRSALSRMRVAGDLTVVTRRHKGSGATAWCLTEQGVARLKAEGLVTGPVRYQAGLSPERVAHQLAMNKVGDLLGIALTHEHQLVMPDGMRERSRTLPDAMFETDEGKRVYLEMDTGNYRADRFREKIAGLRGALCGSCELWIVTPDDGRRRAMLAEVGEYKFVSWFCFSDVVSHALPDDAYRPARPAKSAAEVIAYVEETAKSVSRQGVSVEV